MCLIINTYCISLFWFEHVKPVIVIIGTKCILYSETEPELKRGMNEHLSRQVIDLRQGLIEKENPTTYSLLKRELHSTHKSFIIHTWKYVLND